MREMRAVADRAFSRAAGAPLVEGNAVELLRDGRENYPAWLAAIGAARHHIHFENYILSDDPTGQRFAEALRAKAREGVQVRLLYDWLGSLGRASRRFWNGLRGDGVEVRCYNPPRLDNPLGWFSRDHRKMLAVDGEVAFVTGLCVGQAWEGVPERKIDPWRDTGISVRGPAVRDVEQAFAQVWAMTGPPLPDGKGAPPEGPSRAGEISLRVVASVPATAGMFRFDQLIAAVARERLWLTDAYFAGTTAYVQALRAAAQDGVDVRLLMPNGTDIPLLRPLTRAGYRPLLEAGVRIFEWNGTMLHAKTAVADGRWARIGSTNLNIASWFGNCELDVVVEDRSFARAMEGMFLEDLAQSTEVVLDVKRKVRSLGVPAPAHPVMTSGGGGVGRAAAGAVRIGHAVGAAFTGRRVLEPVESRLMVGVGAVFFLVAGLVALFPQTLTYPFLVLLVWFGAVLLYRGWRLRRERRKGPSRKGQDKAPSR
jgi:cardiolipin synthase